MVAVFLYSDYYASRLQSFGKDTRSEEAQYRFLHPLTEFLSEALKPSVFVPPGRICLRGPETIDLRTPWQNFSQRH